MILMCVSIVASLQGVDFTDTLYFSLVWAVTVFASYMLTDPDSSNTIGYNKRKKENPRLPNLRQSAVRLRHESKV